MLKNLTKFWLILIFASLHSVPLSASASNSLVHRAILEQVLTNMEQAFNPEGSDNIHIQVLPIDSRVKISQCQQPLLIEPAQRRNFTRQFPVKVSCQHEKQPWKVYVQVSVTELVEALVTTANIAKGVTIDSSMIKMMKVEKHRIKSRSIENVSAILGGRAMRNFPRGYQIGVQDVCLVCKGDDVAIIAKASNMLIKTSGTAIENGALGDSIKVKNNNSNRIVKGVIGDLREIHIKL